MNSKSQLDFTVAICTYNGGKRVPEVLDCLSWQLHTQKINWEVIVVDNNSTDNTADVVRKYQQSWPNDQALTYVFEANQGAGYARQKAISVARSPWVGFLDDDNLPGLTWVYEAVKFAQTYPKAGVFGSRIRGVFDGEIPESFGRVSQFLALIDRGNSPLIYDPNKKVLPPGAGMVVRREAWQQNVPSNPLLTGRTAKSMLTGEDLEAVLHIQQSGWEVWYNPAMCVEHKIPQSRLTQKYLTSLMRGIGLSRHRTRMLSITPWQRPFMFWAYSLNDVRKIVNHFCKHHSKVWTDAVTASEMTLYCYSLISPYYLWWQLLKRAWVRYCDRAPAI